MKVIMREIEVVAYFNLNGLPNPIRFRIESPETCSKEVISIESVMHIEETKKAGVLMLRYDCQGLVNGLMRPFQLVYETTKYRWYLFKI